MRVPYAAAPEKKGRPKTAAPHVLKVTFSNQNLYEDCCPCWRSASTVLLALADELFPRFIEDGFHLFARPRMVAHQDHGAVARVVELVERATRDETRHAWLEHFLPTIREVHR